MRHDFLIKQQLFLLHLIFLLTWLWNFLLDRPIEGVVVYVIGVAIELEDVVDKVAIILLSSSTRTDPLVVSTWNRVTQPSTAITNSTKATNLLLLPSFQPFSLVSHPLHHHTSSSYFPWYFDLVVSHHFTNDFSDLSINPTKYKGYYHVSIGDGSSLLIHHVGSSTVPSTSGNILLSKLYHVNFISKNLISVKQYFDDNYVFFEFHLN